MQIFNLNILHFSFLSKATIFFPVISALSPPPSYAECVFGRSDVRDENDDAHTSGDMSWAPAYPYYDWTLHSSRTFTGQQPAVAQQIHSADDY